MPRPDVMVSAVIPAYNYARFVCRAVDSVLAQTYSSLECIVVNDGSTDNTLEVLAPYVDGPLAPDPGGNKSIRVITQKNAGLAAARNTGTRNAQGEYVAFLDADDWWKPEKIEKQMALAEKRPELGAIGTIWERVDGNLKHLTVKVPGRPTEDRAANVRGMACRSIGLGGSGSGVLARRDVFDEVGLFDESMRAAEDIDMWLRIAQRYPVANVDELLTTLCWHGTGTFRNAVLMEENQWKVYHKATTAWPEIFDRTAKRKYRATILSDAGGEYIGAGDMGMALKKYLDSLKEWPWHKGRWSTVTRLMARRMLRKDRSSGVGELKSGGVAK
jgi:glycosyltransferase involved in cell wall biosynthesis